MDPVEAILDLLPEAYLVLSADGFILTVNQQACSLLALAPATLIGRRLHEFADEEGQVGPLLRRWARSGRLLPGVLTFGVPGGEKLAYRCEGGRLRGRQENPALLLRIMPRDASVARFILLNERIEQLGREISRRRLAEASLEEQRNLTRVTLSSIGDAVIATDVQGRITFMNAVAEGYTQWTSADALQRPLHEVFDIINETTREPLQNPVAKVLETGVIVGLANHTILLRRDRSELPIDDSAAPIRDEHGKVFGVVLVFRDITERRTFELQRLEADRRKDEYLAMLAHELRNPLAVIANNVAVLGQLPRQALPQPAAESLDRIAGMLQRHTRHLTRLVDDLLDASRISSGKIALHTSEQPLQPIVTHALDMSRHVLVERDAKLTRVEPAEPLLVRADAQRLAQVIANLLTNAAKFSAPGGRIELSVEATATQVLIRVRDEGIGIAPDMLPRVFDLFSQADQSLARTQGGLGVGLTIVKSLVELHGGSVEARSEGPGRGSEFLIRLPRVPAHS